MHFSFSFLFFSLITDLKISFPITDKAFYGLNVTHTLIANNTGNGIWAQDIRERTVLTNVTIVKNQGEAGFLVRDGAADIWINASRINDNWGDGINVSYAGGSITINGTIISRNKWRGLSAILFSIFFKFLKLIPDFSADIIIFSLYDSLEHNK